MMKTHMRVLHDALFQYAVEQLEEHGEFGPFGGSIRTTGEFSLAVAISEIVDDNERLNAVFAGLCSEADQGRIIAAGYCASMDVELEGYPNGIASVYMVLEDRGGHSTKIVYPYEKSSGGRYHFHDPETELGEGQIFGSTK